jgi:hypothetical protein
MPSESLWSPAPVPAGCEGHHSSEVQRQPLSGLIGLRTFRPPGDGRHPRHQLLRSLLSSVVRCRPVCSIEARKAADNWLAAGVMTQIPSRRRITVPLCPSLVNLALFLCESCGALHVVHLASSRRALCLPHPDISARKGESSHVCRLKPLTVMSWSIGPDPAFKVLRAAFSVAAFGGD